MRWKLGIAVLEEFDMVLVGGGDKLIDYGIGICKKLLNFVSRPELLNVHFWVNLAFEHVWLKIRKPTSIFTSFGCYSWSCGVALWWTDQFRLRFYLCVHKAILFYYVFCSENMHLNLFFYRYTIVIIYIRFFLVFWQIWIWHKLPDFLLGHKLAVNSGTWNLAKCSMMASASSDRMFPKWWLAESAITSILLASPEFFSLEQLYSANYWLLITFHILFYTWSYNIKVCTLETYVCIGPGHAIEHC